MTSKTFKTARADNKVLNVDNLFGNPSLLIKEFDGDTRGFAFAPSDAPALALEILEVAGEFPLGEARWVNDAKYALGEIAILRSNKEVDAKEQAELEAEALELFNAWREVNDMDFIHDFKLLKDEGFDEMWVAVAERAREMRAEK